MRAGQPNYARWYRDLCASQGYRTGLRDWFNDKYLPLTRAGGKKMPLMPADSLPSLVAAYESANDRPEAAHAVAEQRRGAVR